MSGGITSIARQLRTPQDGGNLPNSLPGSMPSTLPGSMPGSMPSTMPIPERYERPAESMPPPVPMFEQSTEEKPSHRNEIYAGIFGLLCAMALLVFNPAITQDKSTACQTQSLTSVAVAALVAMIATYIVLSTQ